VASFVLYSNVWILDNYVIFILNSIKTESMKSKFLLLLVVIVNFSLFLACTTVNEEKVLRHIVLLKFNNEASANDILRIEKEFASLPSKIPEILDFEWGIDNSEEGMHKGYSHSFLVTFKNEEDRAIYLPHHDHMAFVQILQPFIDDVLVIDYWTN